MNQTLERLLQLEGLIFAKRSLQLAGPRAEVPDLDRLDGKINKLRRQVPGQVLSLFDRLAQQYPDPVTALADGTCQGCHQPVPTRSHQSYLNFNGLFQCEHCGRMLFAAQDAPDYIA